MKLFLDANVLFTAAYSPQGASSALFDLAAAGRCHLVASRFAIDEARRNISIKAPVHLAALDERVRSVVVVGEAGPDGVARAQAAPLVEKDAPILAAAWAAHVDVLVTGDRAHFGHLMGRTVEGLVVLTPREALVRLLDG